jgi:hypothetical protein
MAIAQSLLAEFEVQAPITRRFLERLPEDKLTWKPHEKSRSAGQLAFHLAAVPGGVVRFVQNNPAQAPDFANIPQPASRAEILRPSKKVLLPFALFFRTAMMPLCRRPGAWLLAGATSWYSHVRNSFAISC